MPNHYIPFALEARDVATVLPLVHTAAAGIDLARWRNFVQRIIDAQRPSRAGAVGLRGPDGYVCGLLIYRLECGLRHGLVLAVDLFTALALRHQERAIHALIQVAEVKAHELDCAATRVRIHASQKSFAEHFMAAGYAQEAVLFSKAVDARPTAS